MRCSCTQYLRHILLGTFLSLCPVACGGNSQHPQKTPRSPQGLPRYECVREIHADRTSPILALEFHPNNTTLAVGWADGVLDFWDINTQRLRKRLEKKDSFHTLRFAPSGRFIASVQWDGGLYFVPLENLDHIEAFTVKPAKGLNRVSISDNERYIAVASAGRDGHVLIWDVPNRSQFSLVEGHELGTGVLSLLKGNVLFTAGMDGAVVKREVWSGAVIQQRVIEKAAFPKGDIARSEKYAALADYMSANVYIVALDTLRTVATVKVVHSIHDLKFSPDGRLLVVSYAGAFDHPGLVGLYDVPSGVELCTFSPHESSVLAIAITPDGELLVTGSDHGEMKIWDVKKLIVEANPFR